MSYQSSHTGANIDKGINLALAMYPVGSIYLSVNNVNPGTIFGGTWEQIQDRFLLAAGSTYAGGSTGGTATITLTTANMPAHTHTFTGNSVTTSSNGAHTHGPGTLAGYYKCRETDDSGSGFNGAERISSTSTDCNSTASSVVINKGATASAGAHTHTITATGTNSSTGSGTAFNNLPPYLAIYVFKRTA